MKVKKLIKGLALVLVMSMGLACLAACGGSNSGGTEKSSGEAQQSQEEASEKEKESDAASEDASEKESVKEKETEKESEKDDSGEKPEEVTLNVAYMPNYTSLVEVVTAMEIGAFDEEGIKINLVEFADGPTIISAMENGSINVGFIGSGAHKLAINGAAKIFCFAHLGNADAVMGLKSHDVTKAEDLAGKKVGYAPGTSSEAILKQTLESADLTMDDIQPMQMDASGIVSAMVSGSLDACALWSPSSIAVKEELGEDIVEISNNTTFKDQSASVESWIVMDDYAKENRDILLRFTRALMKAKTFRADPDNYKQISEWIADQTGLDAELLYKERESAEWLTADELKEQLKDGSIKKLYESQQRAFIEDGSVEKEVPIEDYVMFDLMLEAAGE